MLVIDNEEYLTEVIEFAEKMGLLGQLQGKLDYLNAYGHVGEDPPPPEKDHRFKVTLYADMTPNCFYIVWQDPKRDGWVMNGGLIYHGPPSADPEDANKRIQNWAVSLENNPIGWRIHT